MKRATLIVDRKKGIYRCSACDWVKDISGDASRRKRDDQRVISLIFQEFSAHMFICPRVHSARQSDSVEKK